MKNQSVSIFVKVLSWHYDDVVELEMDVLQTGGNIKEALLNERSLDIPTHFPSGQPIEYFLFIVKEGKSLLEEKQSLNDYNFEDGDYLLMLPEFWMTATPSKPKVKIITRGENLPVKKEMALQRSHNLPALLNSKDELMRFMVKNLSPLMLIIIGCALFSLSAFFSIVMVLSGILLSLMGQFQFNYKNKFGM